jgi:hypothetical protein
MNMAKYKLCPACNAKNSPAVLECIECGNDLMGVKLIDDSVAPSMSAEPVNQAPAERLIRLCDCGTENELPNRKCTACGEDLTDIVPTPSVDAKPIVTYQLTSMDDQCVLQLTCPGEHVIGRENELADYLSTRSFVSRRHAKITVTSEGVFLENLSRANGTYINNEKLPDGTAYQLCSGDEIGLGGFQCQGERQEQAAYFLFGC